MTIHQYNKEITNPNSVYYKSHSAFLTERNKLLNHKIEAAKKHAAAGRHTKQGRMSKEIRDETRDTANLTVMKSITEQGYQDFADEQWVDEDNLSLIHI